MLGLNLVLLLPMVIASQLCTIALWMALIQRPRVDDVASLVASQILLADRLLSNLSDAERHRQLIEMNGVPTEALAPSLVHATLPEYYLPRHFFARLTSELPPTVQVRQDVPNRRLWVRLRASDALWIALPTREGTEGRFGLLGIFFVLISLATFPMLAAYLIHRRIEGPLNRLARAAVDIECGSWPAAVPVHGPLELVRVTEAFNKMMATLAESEAVRAEMLAGISHDIRTPLTKLRMIAAMPLMFEASAASAERFIEEIDAIVGQFIDFSRGADNELPTLGDLNVLVEQLAGDYAGLGHSFDLELQALPKVSFRRMSVQRLLMNLMQNAVIYGRSGLAVRTWIEAGFAVVSVEDRGPGIPEESLSQMKQPFRRGSHADVKGSGLGLAIAERIARQHSGTLNLVHRPSGGLAAVFRVPIK